MAGNDGFSPGGYLLACCKYRTKEEILELFRSLGVKYISRSRVDWEPLFSIPLDRTPYYLANKEGFERLAAVYGNHIRNAAMAPVYIKKVNDTIGLGVFAAAPIDAGEFIGEYAGVVQVAGKHTVTYTSENGYESDYSWYYLDSPQGAPPLEINGRLEGNEMRFVNHGTAPNLNVEHTIVDGQWVLFFTAARQIAKDEQLLISYGEEYWDGGYRTMAEQTDPAAVCHGKG
ncbi:MAG: hypothetical protein B5M56_02990 [Desulfococcus sp. 4484_241]|nr:MAG: hypothetical protein B5M56_02990 [Desulfococcus sp. 4484_241]